MRPVTSRGERRGRDRALRPLPALGPAPAPAPGPAPGPAPALGVGLAPAPGPGPSGAPVPLPVEPPPVQRERRGEPRDEAPGTAPGAGQSPEQPRPWAGDTGGDTGMVAPGGHPRGLLPPYERGKSRRGGGGGVSPWVNGWQRGQKHPADTAKENCSLTVTRRRVHSAQGLSPALRGWLREVPPALGRCRHQRGLSPSAQGAAAAIPAHSRSWGHGVRRQQQQGRALPAPLRGGDAAGGCGGGQPQPLRTRLTTALPSPHVPPLLEARVPRGAVRRTAIQPRARGSCAAAGGPRPSPPACG